MALSRIPPAELRWRVDVASMKSERDGSASPMDEPLNRLTATLARALHTDQALSGHVFVRGPVDGLREELLERALQQLEPPSRGGHDFCFVHNFDHPDRPRLIRMPAGSGRKLRAGLREISCFIRDRLEEALQAHPIRNRLQALQDRSDAEMDRLCRPLEKKLKPHGLVLVREQVDRIVRLSVHVQQTGRTITQDDLANLVAKGQVGADEFEKIRQVVRDIQPELRDVTTEINKTAIHVHHLRGRLLRAETRRLVATLAQPLLKRFDAPEIKQHLDAIVGDVIEKRVDRPTGKLADPELLYGANLLPAADSEGLAVVREQVPSPRNLGGTIDPSWLDSNRAVASFQGIRGGSLMAAGNGFLVLDAEDLLARPDSVRMLYTALIKRSIPIEAPADNVVSPAVSLRPEPVPIEAHLVVLGTARHWSLLTSRHAELARLFCGPVDVPDAVPRDDAGLAWKVRRIRAAADRVGARISDEGVAALIEQAAREAGPGRLAARLDRTRSRLQHAADIARERGHDHVSAVDVHETLETERPPALSDRGVAFPGREALPGRAHAVCARRDGRYHYGRMHKVRVWTAPADRLRIRFDGPDGDRQDAALRIGSALAEVLHLDRPIGLDVLIGCEPAGALDPALELAALLALLARLGSFPLRQDLAIAGGLDGEGRLAAVDGLNERVEDALAGMDRDHARSSAGVIVPAVQRDALMLRPRTVQAVRNELFQVLAAGQCVQALELLAGEPPGRWRDGAFPEDSPLGRARARLTGGNG